MTVKGDLGKAVTISVDQQKTGGPKRTVAIKGDGDVVKLGETANVHVNLLDACGKSLMSEDGQIPLSKGMNAQFRDALVGRAYGSRVVLVLPASDLIDPSALSDGMKATDPLVMVLDLVPPLKLTPWTQQAPSVTFDSAGKPTVKLSGSPLKTWSIKILREGSGPVVKSGSDVSVYYQGTSWDTGKIFDQNFGQASPATFNTGQVVEGFGGALVGQKVGTRLIVTMPPELGYGTDPNDPNARGLGGQTLVFVIEITKVN